MKLFSYLSAAGPRLGLWLADRHYDAAQAGQAFKIETPPDLVSALEEWDKNKPLLQRVHKALLEEKPVPPLNDITFLPPRITGRSFRDFYAFLQHVKSARALRGLKVIDEWYRFPVFYFSNPEVFYAHGQAVPKPVYSEEMDIELEVACVIGRGGMDIPVEEAENHIAGFTILNDFSARDVQRLEMRVGLGPAKGKDFASGLGPYLVTLDEIEDRRKNKGFDLRMRARKNGRQISDGNFADIHFSFAEMIARASQGVRLYPGEVIGSGTVGTGCILEVRPENTDGWLRAGDEIELEIERLGTLRHTIV